MTKFEDKKNIREILKKHSPKGVKKAKRIFSFKYPKLFILTLSIIVAYFLFTQPNIQSFILKLEQFSYIGILIAGILISFGFSAPFSIGFFLIVNPDNILLATLIGGTGAMLGDLLIFKVIKMSFMDEFKMLSKKEKIKDIKSLVEKNIGVKIQHYLTYIFAGILIMVPGLPDEIGVTLLAGLTTIKTKTLAIIAFALHTTTIFIILSLGITI
ncbi:MAG: hypothetical protein KJ905_02635 [Nanoarchaeota archaeon]|nr:hypothetical protein [Nanoarchaeota archaeon]MBU1501646.1 hypothetical protein [Nanoarchaeota archaeon]